MDNSIHEGNERRQGEMVRNAHLIGFFRRICKLLFLRVKIVFVFDGGTPALKRRTVIARRRQRENAQAKIRKTAEKFLLNHLRTRKLEDLVRQIHNPKSDENLVSGKNEGRVDIGEKAEAGCSSQAVSGNGSYEATDALLATSLAAEGQLEIEASTSMEEIHSDESEDMDESDEMVLPVMQGKVDPSVLAILPPSMQLDLLVQMREQLMADNRQKFQKVKKAPSSFSQLQIEAYLKIVAFRREIEEVQKSAAGKGIGGMQTSQIASESGREFVFSSTFSGDKQALQFPGSSTVETEGRPATKEKAPDVSSVQYSKLNSSLLSGSCAIQPQKETSDGNSDPPVQTYIDEKGQVRVSRARGMGVRLTRHLQWNLYLMKESEEQALKTIENNDQGSIPTVSNKRQRVPYNPVELAAIACSGEKQRFIGTTGASSSLMNPKNAVSQIKRLIGKQFRDPEVQRDLQSLLFTIDEGSDGGVRIHARYLGDNRSDSLWFVTWPPGSEETTATASRSAELCCERAGLWK